MQHLLILSVAALGEIELNGRALVHRLPQVHLPLDRILVGPPEYIGVEHHLGVVLGQLRSKQLRKPLLDDKARRTGAGCLLQVQLHSFAQLLEHAHGHHALGQVLADKPLAEVEQRVEMHIEKCEFLEADAVAGDLEAFRVDGKPLGPHPDAFQGQTKYGVAHFCQVGLRVCAEEV